MRLRFACAAQHRIRLLAVHHAQLLAHLLSLGVGLRLGLELGLGLGLGLGLEG